MIVRNESTLVLLGRDGATAASVTATTGLVPTRATEAGEEPSRGSIRPHSVWQLTVESDPADSTGFGSMETLLASILPTRAALRSLESEFEIRLDWGGFADSPQGGFVLEPRVARGLADLGLPVYGTAYVD